MKKDWEETERLVYLIEKSLNHECTVLHNQKMPVINSNSKRTRQCDIVIISGKEPRLTTTIVEVQRRKSRVDINTFNGWLEKIREIGAQHLICVSKQSFPMSIIEKASQLGNTVLLINLKDFNLVESIPLKLENTLGYYSDFELIKINKFIPTVKIDDDAFVQLKESNPVNINFYLNDKIISINKEDKLSIYQFCRDYLSSKSFKLEEECVLEFFETDNIYLYINDLYIKLLGLKIDLKWKHQYHELKSNFISYEQLGNGTLVWVLEFNFKKDNEYINSKIPLKVKENGYEISCFELDTNIDINFKLKITSNS